MAFDQTTRKRLADFVSDTRSLLAEEFTRQLQNDYGLDPNSGDVTDLARLEHLDDARRETARLLRDTMEHYLASADTATPAKAKKARQDVLDRIVREQAFTILNRLCALRMAEARGLLIESIAKGYQSKGFQLYQRLAGTALGETGACYRLFIFSVFDEFAVDLPVLFDRFSPQGRLFPREAALLSVLQEINHPDIDPLWAEDETIGWIYQYFNSVEERRQMRAASQAPRNSRELAVRNQFFTPRYVVEFLTDNTLGRIWYEMTKGESSLKESCRYLVRRPNEIFLAEGEAAPEQDDTGEELSQEELLKQPVHILHRPLKDPRDIKMLDPACGSMHFGLYAFDLFERIYEEAWEIEAQQGADGFVRTEGLESLHESYPDKDAFLRDVPRLIIERNIHGIDIDPRAVQIAGLSLWLRAQRSWQMQNVKALDRPQIQRSNIVCAEPMPGEAEMLDEFTEQLQPKVLGQLVKIIFEKMKLAGEAGSLLKIEEEIKEAVSTAHEAYRKYLMDQQKDSGYLPGMAPKREATLFDLVGLPEEADFWNSVEERVISALRNYSERAESLAYKRRLFANDAAQGFAFIDICQKNFDVVLMNPPFGQPVSTAYSYLRSEYDGAHHDIYSCFVRRGLQTAKEGMVGVISSRSFLLAPRSDEFRRLDILPCLHLLLDLGLGVMDDAYVESAAYTLKSNGVCQFYVFDDRSHAPNHDPDIIRNKLKNEFQQCFSYQFKDLPKQRILYALPKRMRNLVVSGEPLEPDVGTAREGMKSFDNDRYLRLWWEVSPSSIGVGRYWHRLAKGGGYAFFYSELPLLLNWNRDGAELKATNQNINGSTAQVRQASSYWYRPGATYSKRSAKGFSARVLPSGYIFTSNGPAVLLNENSQFHPSLLIAWLNSSPVRALIQLQANFGDYSTGSLKKLPWPEELSHEISLQLEQLGYELCSQARSRCQQLETSSIFEPSTWQESIEELLNQLPNDNILDDQKFKEIDKLVCKGYGISDISWTQDILNLSESSYIEEHDQDDEEDRKDPVAEHIVERLLSLLLGCAIGRWDVRKIVESRLQPKGLDRDPFQEIPPSPNVILIESPGNDYPFILPHCGVTTDDPCQASNIVAAMRKAYAFLWPRSSIELELVCESLLGGQDLASYIRSPLGFFDVHLRMYSAKPRTAPIYWPISTSSGSYTIWLYYHRLTDQTLYTCVNDFVDPKLKEVSDDATSLRGKSNRSSSEEKELERLSDLELELKDFRDELLRIARFWKPNLNDGVQITAAPLWNLFQHRQWKARLKDTWEKLEAGDYDWAHLALSIWPDRVVRASHKDRSYAIAHDLDDQLWQEVEVEKVGRGGRVTKRTEWQPRNLSSADLQRIITEVKAR